MILLFFIIVLLFLGLSTIKVVSQATVKIIERFGKYHRTATPGLNIIVPFMDRVRVTLDLREQMLPIEPQQVITRDNVTMEVDCVVYWQIIDPVKSIYEFTTIAKGLEQLALSALRAILGDLDLDHTLSQRQTINAKLGSSIDTETEKWGVKVHRVEVRNIIPPEDIRLTMEKQMTAERNKRATILVAEGEKQSAILRAEGAKQSAIVSAEGQKESAILAAEGQAEARKRVAEAEAAAIKVVSESLKAEKGDPSAYLIAMKYLDSLKDISANSNKLVFLPFESSAMMSAFGGIKEIFEKSA